MASSICFDSAFHVAQAGHGAAADNQGLGVGRIAVEHPLDPRLGILELPTEQQRRGRFRLGCRVVGQQICGSDVFAMGARRVSRLGIGVRQLETGLAKVAILLKGVAILEDRFGIFLPVEVAIARLEVLPLDGFDIT